MSGDLYTTHQPRISFIEHKGALVPVYSKTEKDDHLYFRKTQSITINCNLLDEGIPHDGVIVIPVIVAISIPHRKVIIKALREIIRSEAKILTFYGESKYHLPVTKWTIDEGDKDWAAKIIMDNNLSQPVLAPREKVKKEKPAPCPVCGFTRVVPKAYVSPQCGAKEGRELVPCPKCANRTENKQGTTRLPYVFKT